MEVLMVYTASTKININKKDEDKCPLDPSHPTVQLVRSALWLIMQLDVIQEGFTN